MRPDNKLYVHRRVFPGGAQITTASTYFCNKIVLLITTRSSRPTSGVPPAVQVLLNLAPYLLNCLLLKHTFHLIRNIY